MIEKRIILDAFENHLIACRSTRHLLPAAWEGNVNFLVKALFTLAPYAQGKISMIGMIKDLFELPIENVYKLTNELAEFGTAMNKQWAYDWQPTMDKSSEQSWDWEGGRPIDPDPEAAAAMKDDEVDFNHPGSRSGVSDDYTDEWMRFQRAKTENAALAKHPRYRYISNDRVDVLDYDPNDPDQVLVHEPKIYKGARCVKPGFWRIIDRKKPIYDDTATPLKVEAPWNAQDGS